MKNHLIFITLLCLICFSCTSYKTTITKFNLDDTNVTPVKFKTESFYLTYRIAEPEDALHLAETEAQKQAAEALKLVKQGNLKEAAELYSEAIKTKDSLELLWKYFPHNYYKMNYQWNQLEMLENIRENSTDSSFVHYKNTPPFNITFDEEPDTISIFIKHNLPMLKIKIDGKILIFIIDTGTQTTSIYKNVADKIKANILGKNKYESIGLTGNVNEFSGLLENLTIGKTKFQNIPVDIFDANSIDINFLFFNIYHLDGIIGWDILKNFDFTIDYKNEKLILRKPQKQDNQHRNLFWYYMPMVKFYVGKNNYPLLLHFDSGTSESLFSARAMSWVLGVDTNTLKTSKKKVYGIVGSTKQKYFIYPDFSFYTLSSNDVIYLNFTNIRLGDNIALHSAKLATNGILGSAYFKDKAVRIDILNGIFEIME